MRRELINRLLDLEASGAVETTGAGKLDLGWLTKEERGQLRVIPFRVKGHPKASATSSPP